MRREYAAKYQHFATMYLVFIAQIAKRQGYDMFDISVGGRTLYSLVNMTMSVLENPQSISPYTSAAIQQSPVFLEDNQYLSWLELIPSESNDPRIAPLLTTQRPFYNRSLGGYMTLYFEKPLSKTAK